MLRQKQRRTNQQKKELQNVNLAKLNDDVPFEQRRAKKKEKSVVKGNIGIANIMKESKICTQSLPMAIFKFHAFEAIHNIHNLRIYIYHKAFMRIHV